MPELPDVQVFKETLDATSLHRTIEHVYVSAGKMLEGVSASTLRRRLGGSELAGTRRHGKHLFADFGDGWLRLHFGMTGRVEPYEGQDAEGPEPEHTRLRLDFADARHLAFVVQRRLGEIGLVDDPDQFVTEEGLGPDALSDDFDEGHLASALDGRRGMIKSALTDQAMVAGIGNVYSDEICFQARIHPRTPAADVDDDDIEEIHRQAVRVLEAAIHARVEDFPDWFLLPHRHEGGECPACGAELERTEVSGRATWYCPRDQGSGA